MKDRIRQIQEKEQMTQRDFAAALGISPSSLSSIYNGHTSPTSNHVQAIHRRFPEINTDWVMFGEGEMFRSQHDDQDVPQSGTGTQGEGDRPTASSEGQVTGTPDTNSLQLPAVEGAAPAQVIIRETVKYIDKPQRRITEIRVFYDDGTFDTFSGT